MNNKMEFNLITLDFEPQDDISGFLRRANVQKKAGRNLTCPFKNDGRCNQDRRYSTNEKSLCDNDYTSCQDYNKLNLNYQR
jgi:hypothetical protein